MPTAVTDPFGNTLMACSISTAVKAKFKKDAFASEAEWSQHVKADAFHVIQAKIKNGEIKKNTVVGQTTSGNKLVFKQKADGTLFFEQSVAGGSSKMAWGFDEFENLQPFKNLDWDFGPNMAKTAQRAAEAKKAAPTSFDKLGDYLQQNNVPKGTHIATNVYDNGAKYEVRYNGIDNEGFPQFTYKAPGTPGEGTMLSPDELKMVITPGKTSHVEWKIDTVADVAPAAGLPVASTSKSVGALTNEDAATLFVKTKDKLAQEAGINIKGASGKLDELVYKTIADQAGYTPAEMLAKVEAYKGSGKKLSALKKKVLPKSGNPTKVATDTSVNKATAAVKKEEIKPEEVVQVWDDEAVAKAYIKAKDHVVATNDHGWTLYTKNDQFDAEIHKWMQADLGPIKPHVADTAIANYIANTQKLSVLKKQMIKKGELVPKADTLKGTKVKNSSVGSPDELTVFMKSADGMDLDIGDVVATVKHPGGEKIGDLTFDGMDSFGNPKYKMSSDYGTEIVDFDSLMWYHKSPDYEIEYKVGQKPPAKKPAKASEVNDLEGLKKALANGEVEVGDIVAVMTDKGAGQKYLVKYEGKNVFDFPQFEFHYPSGTFTKMTQSDLSDVINNGDYHTEFKVVKHEAPKETGAGQVGKATVDPKKVDPKHILSPEKAHEVFLQWEGLNLPISSSGAKLYGEAKNLAKQYGFGDDVLPILKAVDAGKTAKFGLQPSANKNLYELKVVEHLKNPHASNYTSPAAAPTAEAKVFGELPPDSDLFSAVSASRMHDIAISGMVKPTPGQSRSLRTYSGSTYHEINGHLRQGKAIETNTYTKSIQDSMSPLPEAIITRRGTSLEGLGMASQEQLTASIGKTYIEPGFSSTAVGGSGQFGGQVNLVIQAPKGTKAVWLKPHSNISGENELLLAAGTKFKILKVEQKPGNWGSMTNIVTVRVIP